MEKTKLRVCGSINLFEVKIVLVERYDGPPL